MDGWMGGWVDGGDDGCGAPFPILPQKKQMQKKIHFVFTDSSVKPLHHVGTISVFLTFFQLRVPEVAPFLFPPVLEPSIKISFKSSSNFSCFSCCSNFGELRNGLTSVDTDAFTHVGLMARRKDAGPKGAKLNL